MVTELPVTDIAHTIQLAVALVFVLTGVATILSMLTNRLGRIIDRSRVLHARTLSMVEENADIQIELKSLRQRAKLIHWAIGLCTVCLLLICTVVTVLFLVIHRPKYGRDNCLFVYCRDVVIVRGFA
jgi:hypothetical protein